MRLSQDIKPVSYVKANTGNGQGLPEMRKTYGASGQPSKRNCAGHEWIMPHRDRRNREQA